MGAAILSEKSGKDLRSLFAHRKRPRFKSSAGHSIQETQRTIDEPIWRTGPRSRIELTLDSETRKGLKMLLDKATRRAVEKDRRITHPPVLCMECRTDRDAWTAGCRTCNIRHYG